MKRFLIATMTVLLLLGGSTTVMAVENQIANGTMDVIYVAPEDSSTAEIPKGDGKPVKGDNVKTGDQTVLNALITSVITSAILLVVIIYLQNKNKGEKRQ